MKHISEKRITVKPVYKEQVGAAKTVRYKFPMAYVLKIFLFHENIGYTKYSHSNLS
jgi:hypothetical protein